MAIWADYFDNAYISCFHYLVNKKLHWTERLFWLITILICMASTYYMVSKCVAEYGSQNSAYRADTDYLHWETSFPSVVICERKADRNRPADSRSRLNKTLINLSFNETYLEDIRENALDIAFLWPPILSGTFTNHCPASATPEKCLQGNYSYVMKMLRHNCTDLLTYCEYNGVPFSCCDEFLPVNTTFGICYAFNNYAGRYKNGSRPSTLPFKIRRKPGLQEGKLFMESKTSNLVISALSPNAVPNLGLGKYAFKSSHMSALNDKTIYYHYMKVEEIITLESAKLVEAEKRGCRFPQENNLKYFDLYSEANCQIECYIMAQKQVCGCAVHTCPVGRSEECNLTGVLCTNDNKNIMEYTHHCHCLTDCFSSDVRTIGSTTKAVQKNFKFMDQGSRLRYIAVVPAPTLRYIRYSTTSSIDTLVLVGGTVGFFIGFSFLSIAQWLYYVFVRTTIDQYRLITEKRRVKKQREMDENFALAKAKLKMVEVEDDIKKVLQRRIDRINVK